MIKALLDYGRADMDRLLKAYIYELSSYRSIGDMQFKFYVNTKTDAPITIIKKRSGGYQVELSTTLLNLAYLGDGYPEAILLLLGHEISHRRYPYAHGNIHKVTKETSNPMSAQLLRMCMEAFADAEARSEYKFITEREEIGQLSSEITEDIICKYTEISLSVPDSEAVKFGLLPSSVKVDILRTNYPLEGYLKSLYRLFRRYWIIKLGLPLGTSEYDPRLSNVNAAIDEVTTILRSREFFRGKVVYD